MSWDAAPYTAVLLLATLVSLVVVVMALRVRFPSGSRSAFVVFMSSVAAWSASYMLEVASPGLDAKLFWANLQYAGVLLAPPALLAFLLLYANQQKWLTRRAVIVFIAVTLAFQALVWTDGRHHLLRQDLALALDPIPELVFSRGPLFHVIIVYSYLVLFLGVMVLVRSMLKTRHYDHGLSYALLMAILIPWAGSLLEALKIDVIPHLSPVVFSFILSGGIFVWAFWRYRLFDILPVAERAIFANLPDGILVLDLQMRVRNINPAASRIFRLHADECIGSHFQALRPELEHVLQVRQPVETRLNDEPDRWYEFQASDLYDGVKEKIGLLLMAREVTWRKEIEEALRESELQYRSVCERANDGIVILQDELVKYINPQLAAVMGYADESEVVGRPFLDFIKEEDRMWTARMYTERMAGKPVQSRYELTLLRKSGEDVPVEINASLAEYGGEKADLIFLRDISEQKRTREELQAKNQALEAAVMNAEQLMETAERRARELETLQQATQVVNTVLDQEQILQRIMDQLARVVPYDSAAVYLKRGSRLELVGGRGYDSMDAVLGFSIPMEDAASPVCAVFQAQQAMVVHDLRAAHPAFADTPPHQEARGWLGVPLVNKLSAVGLLALNSKSVGHFNPGQMQVASAFASQVAVALENARLFEEVQRLAITDPLTNLFNRRHFYELTMREYLRYRRYGAPFSVMMLDADHFKHVNDSYGHLAGDRVLQALADLFRENMRKVDILCRFGGEEFIATLPETHAQEARHLAERLRSRIESAVIQTDAGNVRITVSIGVAEFCAACGTLDRLLDCADKALYAAKTGGRNQVTVYLTDSQACR